MAEYVSQRQFAKVVGRSHVWVNRLVKEGRLPADEKGRIPLEDGLKAYEASQVVGYDANRAHGEKQRSKGKAPAKAAAKGKAREPDEPELLPDNDDVPPITGGPSHARVAEAYNRARTAEKTFQAKLKELEYKEAQGLLLPLADVEADAAETAAELREKLMSMPPRIAPLCEGKQAREIEGILEDAINEALLAFQKSRFARG